MIRLNTDMRLRRRYSIITILTIALSSALLSLILTYQAFGTLDEMIKLGSDRFSNDLMEQMKIRGEAISIPLAENLTDPLYNYDMRTIERLLSAALQQHDVTGTIVYDSNGKIVHDGNDDMMSYGKDANIDDIDTEAPGARHPGFAIYEDSISIQTPIWVQDVYIGGVKVILSLDNIRNSISHMIAGQNDLHLKALRSIIMSIVISVLLMVVIGALVSVPLSAHLIDPIRKLREHTVFLDQGKYGIQMESDRDDELGELIGSFNDMSYGLKDAYDRIQNEMSVRLEVEEALRASLREKEVLLKEIHHRVKNNMQVVNSLLFCQAEKETNSTVRELFKDAQNRILTLSLVHECLYNSENLSDISFGKYITSLLEHLIQSNKSEGRSITATCTSDEFSLNLDTMVPCGLIINEVVSNIYKHAFPGRDTGGFSIKASLRDNRVTITVSDSGVGLPDGFDLSAITTLGLTLVKGLAEQIGATVKLDTDGGTRFQMEFVLQG